MSDDKEASGEPPRPPPEEPPKTLVEDDSVSIMSHGETIDKELVKLHEAILKLKKKEEKLTDAGCLLARIHFKTDRPNIMYMLLPTDSTGKRKYVHVGVDSEKQNEAIAKVSRYEQREIVRKRIGSLQKLIDHCQFRLSSMLSSLQCQIKQEICDADF